MNLMHFILALAPLALGQTTTSLVPTASLRLEGSSITVLDDPAEAVALSSSNTSTMAEITAAGVYVISGSLKDGQIKVDVNDTDDGDVVLALNGTDIASTTTTAPILVLAANSVTIHLVGGTENRITGAASVTLLDEIEEDPNAAIYSKADLTIEGDGGTLVVEGNYKHGIASNDHLKIQGGCSIMVEAVSDGIRGKDSIQVTNSTTGSDILGPSITVVAGGDALQSHKKDEGFIWIDGGFINLTSARDGIQADANITILGGDITISAGGGANTNNGGTAVEAEEVDKKSTKGIKAKGDIIIENGNFHVDSLDDALHADGSITINGGALTLASTDDAIKGSMSVTIHGGDINITQCYEGIESDSAVTIHGGVIHIISLDDGIQVGTSAPGMEPPPALMGIDWASIIAASESGEPLPPCPEEFANAIAQMGGFPAPGGGGSEEEQAGDVHISIHGGYIYVDSIDGDGLDSNGKIDITGGTVVVNGPRSVFNLPLDTDGDFTVSGGFVLAIGTSSSGLTPSSATSTQLSVRYAFDETHPAATMIHMASQETGEGMFTIVPNMDFRSFVFSSPDLVMGDTYNIYVGGSVEGPCLDGLCAGAYTPDGAEVGTITLDSVVVNESRGMEFLLDFFLSCTGGAPGGAMAVGTESDNTTTVSGGAGISLLGVTITAMVLMVVV